MMFKIEPEKCPYCDRLFETATSYPVDGSTKFDLMYGQVIMQPEAFSFNDLQAAVTGEAVAFCPECEEETDISIEVV